MPKCQKQLNKNASQTRSGTSLPLALNVRLLAGVATIVLASFLAYLPSLSGEFILDDDKLLTANPLIKASDGLYSFWCTTKAQDYWPVSNTALWFEWRLWGLNPTGYHVTNLILHIAGALLLWIILRKLSLPGAFLTALLFALHPVNVESVAWIAQRKGLLAMLFFLLSILCYLRHFSVSCSDNAQGGRHTPCAGPAPGVCGLLIGRWYWLSLLAFVLAMLSKGSVAILPLLLLWIVWWLRTGTVPIFASAKMGLSPSVSRWDLVRTAPFFAVAVVLAGVNLWFQTHGTDIVIRTASFAQRLLGAGGVVWFYLYKALLPLNLVFIYPQWHIEAGNLPWWLPLMAAVTLTIVLWQYRQGWSRPFLFAWGFFCVSLLPVLGFADVGFMQYSPVADHYQHIAIIGVIALAAAGWDIWHQSVQGPARALAVVVVSALIFLTWQQSGLYSNAMTLYQVALEKNPDCSMVHNNLGIILVQAGRPEEAVEHFQQALRLKPDNAEAHNNLGNVLDDAGRPQEAMEHYREALRLKPNYTEAHFNLGLLLAKAGRLSEAIEHYRQTVQLQPDYLKAHNNLGVALIQAGRSEEAIECFQQALRLQPDYAEAYNNLGVALDEADRLPEAIEQFRQALRLQPDYPEAQNNLGKVLIKTGRSQEAIAHFQQALRLKANFSEAYYGLALAYAIINRPPEAVAAAQKALAVARSQEQTTLVKQIDDWLNAYRASLSTPPSAKPAAESAPPRP